MVAIAPGLSIGLSPEGALAAAEAMIDHQITELGGQSLVDADRVRDMLLDLRLLMAGVA